MACLHEDIRLATLPSGLARCFFFAPHTHTPATGHARPSGLAMYHAHPPGWWWCMPSRKPVSADCLDYFAFLVVKCQHQTPSPPHEIGPERFVFHVEEHRTILLITDMQKIGMPQLQRAGQQASPPPDPPRFPTDRVRGLAQAPDPQSAADLTPEHHIHGRRG